MLEDYFPAAKDGRSDVTFYLLPNQTMVNLTMLLMACWLSAVLDSRFKHYVTK